MKEELLWNAKVLDLHFSSFSICDEIKCMKKVCNNVSRERETKSEQIEIPSIFVCVSLFAYRKFPFFVVYPQAVEEKFARCRVPPYFVAFRKLFFHTEIMNNIQHRFVLIRKLLLIAPL